MGVNTSPDLTAREADIAVRLTAKPPEDMVGRREIVRLRHGIYGTTRTLRELSNPDVIHFESEVDPPLWVTENFPNARIVLRVDDVTSMVAATKNHIGLSRMPCFIGDSTASLHRLDAQLKPSDWGVDLKPCRFRATARVRVCREFLLKTIEQQRPLIQGEKSRYV